MLIYDMYTFGDVCYISAATVEEFFIACCFWVLLETQRLFLEYLY